MADSLLEQTDWTSCPTGEIQGLVSTLRRKHRTRKQRQIAGIATSVLGLLLFGVLVVKFTVFDENGQNNAVVAEREIKVQEARPSEIPQPNEATKPSEIPEPNMVKEPTEQVPAQMNKLIAGIYCEDVREMAEAYLKDELSEDKHDSIERHLAICKHCRSDIDAMARELGLTHSRFAFQQALIVALRGPHAGW